MPEIITCPDCDRKLRVPDNLLGKKVKCPGCSVMFTAVAGGSPSRVGGSTPPPEDPIEDPVEERGEDRRRDAVLRRDDYDDRRSRRRDDDYDDDRRVRRRDDDYDDDRPRRRDDDDDYGRAPSARDVREAWRKVRTGISLNIIGTWVWIGGAVFMALGVVLGLLLMGSAILSALGGGVGMWPSRAAANSAGAGLVMLGITAIIFALCSLAEIVLRCVGYGMCMGVPALPGRSFKPLAITAFSLAGAEALFRILGCTLGAIGGAAVGAGGGAFMPLGGNIVSWIANVLCLAALIVFLLFARSVASHVRDRGLPSTLLTVLIVFSVFYLLEWIASVAVVFGWFGTIFSAIGSSSATSAASKIGTFGVIVTVLGSLMFLAYLGLEVWFIFAMQHLRDSIQRHLAKLQREE